LREFLYGLKGLFDRLGDFFNRSFFLNSAMPEEVRVLYRDESGYTQAKLAADIQGIREFIDAGATMGHLWLEGRFGVGDPLVNAGAPRPSPTHKRTSR
jgi:hypothetical protein